MSSPILIIGIGNEYRSDDGVGPVIARKLQSVKLPGTHIIECSGEGTTLLDAWADADTVLLIDAASSGAPPGTLYRFDLLNQALPASVSFQSSHTFGVAGALELARILDQLPKQVILYAIEARSFSPGIGLAPEVEKAAQELIELLEEEVLLFSNFQPG